MSTLLSAAVQQISRPPRRPSAPPQLSGGLPLVGHMGEWIRNPFALLMRARREGGEVVEFNLLGTPMVLLTGPEANEAFFRAPDDQICRREAYKLMTPIFGEGVVFDAPGDRLGQQLGMVMKFLRDHKMRGYPPVIEDETKKALATWGNSGEIDLLEVMKNVTLYGSSRCLIGDEFRGGMDEEFRILYEALEKGVNPIAYFQPHLPLPSFKRRDSARVRLVERVEKILSRRGDSGPSDGLQALREATYTDGQHLSAHEITGILIAIMMAGHHTSAGTGTWVIVELLRNPHLLPRLRAEMDAVWPVGTELTYERLRQMKFLGDVLKEVLRLHPPLIFLLRKVLREFRYNSYVVPAGQMLCAAPVVSHRLDSVFENPETFDPDRFDRGEADNPFAWIPFGGGKNKCTGNAFGLLQLKAIVAVLMRDRDFELVSPPASYKDNYNAATVMPKGPVRIRHRKRNQRSAVVVPAAPAPVKTHERFTLDPKKPVTIKLDLGLCQGHSVCVSEAPDVFKISARGDVEVLMAKPGAERYEALVRAAEHCPNQVITLEQ
ncbi:MAG: cytochrome P450 [Myxococcales bacterium]|nr:cytochrome P450 [Myxococcales bacterium]